MIARLPNGLGIKGLSDGKGSTFNQIEVFHLVKLLQPSERIMTVNEHDKSIQSRAYESLPTSWWRCREYAFYRKDPAAKLGQEIVWAENGINYKLLVPDVPIEFYGKTMSLQNTVGMGVCSSIRLLDIRQMDTDMFVVSATDPEKIKRKIRAVDFSGNEYVFALTDGIGLPIASMPSHHDNPDARNGSVAKLYGNKSTGWHGSLARGITSGCGQRNVYADLPWMAAIGVAVVER